MRTKKSIKESMPEKKSTTAKRGRPSTKVSATTKDTKKVTKKIKETADTKIENVNKTNKSKTVKETKKKKDTANTKVANASKDTKKVTKATKNVKATKDTNVTKARKTKETKTVVDAKKVDKTAKDIKDTKKDKKTTKETKVRKVKEKTNYSGFYLENEYAASGEEKIILSSKVINDQKEIIMSSSKEIEVIKLKGSRYLINSNEQTMIIEIVNKELQVIISVTRPIPGETYKVTKFLKENGVVILTDYNPEEKRNYEYLYDYRTGKRISSGFDSIDEVNGTLKVTYGLAEGDLDLEGNFTMEPEKEYQKPKNIFSRLFSKNKGKC